MKSLKEFIFRKNTRPHGHRRTFSLVRPARDWFVGLVATTLLLIGGMLYAANLFITEIGIEYFDADPGAVQIETYKRSVVESVLETYQKKTSSFVPRDTEVPSRTPPGDVSTSSEVAGETVDE